MQSIKKYLGYIIMQIMILFYAYVITYFPEHYGIVITVFFISYFAIFFLLSYRSMRGSLRGKEAEEVKRGRVILKATPEKVMQLIQRDTEFNNEWKAQMKFTLMPMAYLPLIFIIFYVFNTFIIPTYMSETQVQRFIGSIIMFEAVFMIPTVINRMYFKKKSIKMMQSVFSYTITDKGIHGPGILVKFPVDHEQFDVVCNRKRGFIEFVRKSKGGGSLMMGGGARIAFRFYIEKISFDKVLDALKKYGKVKVECT